MDPSFGGPSQGIRNFIPEMEKMGIQSEVLCLDRNDADFLCGEKLVVHALGPGRGRWGFSRELIPWLLRNIMRFNFIIIDGIWQYHGYAVQKAIQHFKKQKEPKDKIPKVFIMPHGMLDPYFQRAPERKIKALRNWLYWKLIQGKLINKADGILFTCESELRLANETFHPYSPKSVINVGYGIKTPPAFTDSMKNAFIESCPGISQSPYLLFLSRITQKKGVDLLVRAFEAELEKNQSHGKQILKLVIAGPGLNTPYGKKIQRMVAKNKKLRDTVYFPGMLVGDAKWGAFYGCQAFVLPSHQENFGIAIVEALACSRPVLISNQVNIWQEIESNGAGIIEKDSLDGTKLMLKRWGNLNNKDKYTMSRKAEETYIKNFSAGPANKKLLIALQE
jgi:glycosyltransferase involved in cell wall biosynthesis